MGDTRARRRTSRGASAPADTTANRPILRLASAPGDALASGRTLRCASAPGDATTKRRNLRLASAPGDAAATGRTLRLAFAPGDVAAAGRNLRRAPTLVLACSLLLGAFAAMDAPAEPLPPPEQSAADLLMQIWPGIRDSNEQVVFSPDRGPATFSDQEALRVRTVVARVQVPWLALRVLYIEEFLHDDPTAIRRQILLRVEPELYDHRRVRAIPFTFKDPARWRQLNRSPRLLAKLRPSDLEPADGCDLVLHQEGDQFRGGTTGLSCADDSRDTELYVDYRTVIGSEVYWYRRRLLRQSDDELVEEVMGYNWFEPNDTRLFTCRVQWSGTGKPSDLHQIVRVDVHDQGGRTRFTTPDGRKFELSLHSEDWPFAADRDALILLLEDPDTSVPIASAWTALDAHQIAIDLGWMNVNCGPLVPETDEVNS